jgi:cell wall-associated NlpC family hydrolase
MAPGSGYVSPYALSGLTPAFISDLGALGGSGRLNATVCLSTPQNVTSGPNPWYDMSLYHPPATGPQAQGITWGPQSLLQPQPRMPQGVISDSSDSVAYYVQRLIATAEALIGTTYQHHHDPLWNPYANGFSSDKGAANYWPWSSVSTNTTSNLYTPEQQLDGTWKLAHSTFPNPYAAAYGQGMAGIDCSDLTSLVYNVSAGIYMNSAIGQQGVVDDEGHYCGTSPLGWNNKVSAVFVDPSEPTSAAITSLTPQFLLGPNSVYDSTRNARYIKRFNHPGTLDSVIRQLQAGDLLFIAGSPVPTSSVTHVVLWLGEYGTMADGSPSPVPLVISSHDNTPAILDANGNMPPPGVAILPFDSDSWFYQNFSHAMRVLSVAD